MLVGTGQMMAEQRDFGIEPTTAAGGLVKVQDDMIVTLRIVARSGGT